MRGATLMEEKANALTEYAAIQLVHADEAFALRARIDAMPPAGQIAPLVALSLSAVRESTPQLSYWASMRLLRLPAVLKPTIGEEFSLAAVAHAGDDLVRARALRAAEYFGLTLAEAASKWLANQPDAGVDPLVLRPHYYPA